MFLTALIAAAGHHGSIFDRSPILIRALVIFGILAGICTSFFFVTAKLDKWTAEKRERNSRLIFPGAMWLRGLYLCCIVLAIAMMIGMYREGDRGLALYVPMLFVFLGYFPWPRAVSLDGVAVRQRDAFLRLTSIPYGEIESVVFDAQRVETVVFGKNGKSIVHSNMHVDAERFITQLESITGKDATVFGA
jgi:hypothetical protein